MRLRNKIPARAALSMVLLAALIVAFASCGNDKTEEKAAGADDAIAEVSRQAPLHGRILCENDYVMAAEFDVPPGDGIPTHYGRSRAVYALNAHTLEFTIEDSIYTETVAAGDLRWQPSGLHSVHNPGPAPARFLVVFRKLSRLFEYSLTGTAEDFTCVAGDRAEVLLENEIMRVARFTLEPKEQLLLHRGLNRVMCPLTSYSLRYTTEHGEETLACEPGQVRYLEAGNHAVANLGETTARYLMFELRE